VLRIRSETQSATFVFAAPTVWNTLPSDIQNVDSYEFLGSFKDTSVRGQMTSVSPHLRFYPRVEVLVALACYKYIIDYSYFIIVMQLVLVNHCDIVIEYLLEALQQCPTTVHVNIIRALATVVYENAGRTAKV
jgi:hypothetical protein